MSPFQQLRRWLHSGPAAERATTAVVAVVVLALAVWAVVPTNRGLPGDTLAGETTPAVTGTAGSTSGAATGTTTGQAPGGSASATGVAGAGSVTGGGSGAAGTTAGSASSATGTAGLPGTPSVPECRPAPSGQGVSAKEILVGIPLVTIGALNSAIGIPSEEDHQRAYRAVFDHYNKRGGVQCRKLVPKFYSDNVLDSASEQAVCLQMQQDKVFAVINNLFNADTITCVAQAKIPNFWYTAPHTPQIRKYAPYILSFQPDYDRLITTYVRGAKQVGWFAGMKKIGLLDQTCYPDLGSKIRSELRGAGFPDSTWSVYNYGCTPNGTGQEPEKDTQAAVQFNREGVTHVLSVAYGKTTQFAKAAERQQYRPKYAIMSDAQIQAADRSSAGQAEGLDGALDVTSDQIGAENTPGIKFSAATAQCRKIITGAGLRDPVDPLAGTAGTLYGVACASTAMLVAAIDHAPELNRASLAAGLARVGAMDLSFPAGPSVFNNPANPTGGQFWRTAAFEYDCNCWKVTSARWRPGFV